MGMGAMGGAAAGMGLLSLGQSNGNGNGNGTLSSAALSMSAEGRFGLAGLLDVIRMTDKVRHVTIQHIALHRITAQHSSTDSSCLIPLIIIALIRYISEHSFSTFFLLPLYSVLSLFYTRHSLSLTFNYPSPPSLHLTLPPSPPLILSPSLPLSYRI